MAVNIIFGIQIASSEGIEPLMAKVDGEEIYRHPKKRHRAEKYERDEKHQRRNRAIYG